MARSSEQDKPNIEDVFRAFQRFQSETSAAGINTKKHLEARDRFKAMMEKFGLAEHIDWSEPE